MLYNQVRFLGANSTSEDYDFEALGIVGPSFVESHGQGASPTQSLNLNSSRFRILREGGGEGERQMEIEISNSQTPGQSPQRSKSE